MPNVQGYLQLSSEFGCVELIHDCRTLAFMRNSAELSKATRGTIDCTDCCCPDIDPVEYTTPDDAENPAPWYDPDNPASAEFLGLFGRLEMVRPTGTTGSDANRRLVYEGIAFSETTRGRAFGLRWIGEQLEPACKSCTGTSATIYPHCPSECGPELDENDEPIVIEFPDPATAFDLSTLFADDCCELEGADAPLGPAAETLILPDNGARTLIQVRYVPGSFTELATELPSCFGQRVTFEYEILGAESFTDGHLAGRIEPPAEGEPNVACQSISFGDVAEVNQLCDSCGPRCACVAGATLSSEDGPAANLMADGVAECRWSMPLRSRTWATLIEDFSWDLAAPVIEIHAGSGELIDARVQVWEAVSGLPNIITCAGADQYDASRIPCGDALITRVPPAATLTLDARSMRETLTCPGFGEQPASSLVSGCDGRFEHARMCCGRYWVTIELPDCVTHTDWSVDVWLHGVESAS